MAPEASIPVALNLAHAAVDSLLAVYPRIAIVGDSAGGGLTLATLAKLSDRTPLPLPFFSHPGPI